MGGADRFRRSGLFIDHHAFVSLLDKEPRRAQSSETGAYNRDGFRPLGGLSGNPWLACGDFRIDGMHHEIGDGYGFIVNTTAAPMFAGTVADAAENPREREIASHGCCGQTRRASAHVLEYGGNAKMGGTDALAGRKTVAKVIAEQQLQRHAAGVAHGRSIVLDFHAIDDTRGARWNELTAVLEFHRADHARGSGLETVEKTQSWNLNARRARRLQDRRTRLGLDVALVDGKGGHGPDR